MDSGAKGGEPGPDAGSRPQTSDEARLGLVARHASDGLILITSSARVLWASPAIERLSGRKLDEVTGEIGFDFVHPEDLMRTAEALGEMIEDGKTENEVLLRLRRADGEFRWQEVRGRLLDDEARSEVASDDELEPDEQVILLTVRDVHDRVLAQNEVQATKAWYEALVLHSSDVMVVIDRDGDIRYATPSSEPMFGLTLDDMAGRDGLDFIHPDDGPVMRDALDQVLEDPALVPRVIVRAKHGDGTWHAVEATLVNLLEDPNVAGIVVTARDVSERMRIDEEIRLSEERFRALVQNASDAVVVVDPDGTISYASRAVERLFGRPLDQVVGTSGTDLVHPEDVDMVLGELASLAEQPEASIKREFRILDGNGSWRWVEATVVNMIDNEAVEGVVANVRDISDRKELEARLAHAATHDPRTGLANRALLLDRLEVALARSRRSHRAVSVLFVDLDDFKLVNDRLGHDGGDRVLTAMAQRLEIALRPGDTVARWGGDEFVVVCEDLDEPEAVVTLAERLRQAVTGQLVVEGVQLVVGATIGISISTAHADAETMIRDSDAALYRAKAQGKGCMGLLQRDGTVSVWD